ncbi:outer membrane protein [Modicisalibacter muralis]|uniref:Outer membrane protein n=1 Tax=Modicisalibacter muralis TaxID=119000 RepID=A0A1G9PTN5_9GAMM|nr:OmpW family outer membrane protein [Halomonas muralis]SDM01831.1 outer membrane protein [Halomonas muralis]
MTKIKLLSAAIIAGSTFAASQAALAYEAGDVLVRGGIAKVNPEGDAEGMLSNENGFVGSLGFMVHDKLAISLGAGEEFEHEFDQDAYSGKFEQQPFDLMVQYYPLGGLDSRIQPYAGVGANYTRFSSESDGLSIDNTWAPKGELGVDLMVTENLALNGFASYTNLDADYSLNGVSNEADIDPIIVGGGVTFSF